MTPPEFRPRPFACGCAVPARRLFNAALLAGGAAAALPAGAREGVDVGGKSFAASLVPAERIEQAAGQQYHELIDQARAKRALLWPDHPQVVRLRTIAARIVPFAVAWNPRARAWRWEVNVIQSGAVNAFCMPSGKIACFTGLLEKVRPTDAEVAMVMGHEMAHALREHARERMGKTMATRGGIEVLSALFGLGTVGRSFAGAGGRLMTLSWGRGDESEADLIGMELAARAGYDPRAGVTLWQKMGALNTGTPPQWLSTHPSGPTRIHDIERNLPKVEGLYARAPKPPERFDAGLAAPAR